jgi:hypothetical protein
MLLVQIPWASPGLLGYGPYPSSQLWLLPSVMLPSGVEGTREDNRVGLGQLLLLVRRWYPQREIVAVADHAYASLKLLDRCRNLRSGQWPSSPVLGWTRRPLAASRLLRVVAARE